MKIKNSTFIGLLLLIVLVGAGLFLYIEKTSKKAFDFVDLFNVENKLKTKDFYGVWQDTSVMASGWSDRYQLFPSGKYNYRVSQMSCNSKDRGHSGFWSINKDGDIELTIKQRITIDEDQMNPDDFGGCGTPDIVSDVFLNEKIIINQCPKDVNNPLNISCLSFNENYFYKFNEDPSYGQSKELDDEPVFDEDSSSNSKIIKEEDIVGTWSWDQSPEIIFEIEPVTNEHIFRSYLHCRPDSSGNWKLDKNTLILNTDYGMIYTYKNIKISDSKISAINEGGDQIYFTPFVEGSSVDSECP